LTHHAGTWTQICFICSFLVTRRIGLFVSLAYFIVGENMSAMSSFLHSGRISQLLARPYFPQASWILANKYSSVPSNDDLNFLHKSIMPSDHFQRSLPRLPVPKLEDTCRRYLKALEPLLNEADLQRTTKVVDSFRDGDGKALQEELKAKDKQNKHTSYVSGPWFDMYLKDRQSIVLNYNPFMMFSDGPNKPYNEQLVRSTNFIVSSMRLLKTMRANILEPEVYHLYPEKSDNQRFRKFVSFLPKSISWYGALIHKAFPLDMSQYGNLFNSTRIPR
jgi:carnitine O-palmitoyltransferase 2